MKLEDAPNLGKVICEKLREAEILDVETLTNLGAEQTFTRLVTIDSDCGCYQMLCALEGAIQGVRWHNLDKDRKNELKEFSDFVLKDK